MKVLILTYYWPPAGGSGVQRWLKFVKYLPEFGIEPIVYTAKDPNYALVDDSLKEEVRKEQEVIYGKILEPNDLMHPFAGKKKISAGFLDSRPGFGQRLLNYIRANFFIPDARMLWIRPSVKLLSSYLENNRVEALITTGPPHSVHLIGRALKKRFGIPWISDFRDPWTNIDYFHSLPLSRRSKNRHAELERAVLQESDAVIVVGRSMQQEFRKFNSQVHVIPNGYDDHAEAAPGAALPGFTLTHIGLMNADRNPKVLWRALQELNRDSASFASDLRVRLIGKCSDEVVKDIEECGLEGHVEIVDYIPHREVMQYQLSSQVLLLCVNRVPSARAVVTGKVFEYLQAGRPILGIGPTDGDLAAILQEAGSGVMVDFDDKERLKTELLKLHKAYLRGSLSASPKGVEKYHRRNLTKDLAKLIQRVTGTTGSDLEEGENNGIG